MKLSRYIIIGIIVLVSLALFGLLRQQSLWMDRALTLHRKNQESQVQAVLENAKHHMQEDPIYAEIKAGHYNCDFPMLYDSLELTQAIHTVLKGEFERAGMEFNYDFGLYNQQGEVLLGNVTPEQLPSCNRVGSHFFCKGNLHHHLYLRLPQQEVGHWQAYAATLAPSLGLISIILAAFVFTIFTILRQKRLTELKDDFINNMTHELKTPIFSINMASSILRKSEEVQQSERLKKCSSIIDEESKRLGAQVDKVLQMALIDSGNLKLEKSSVDVHELIRKSSESFELAIQEQGGRIQLQLEALNPLILADKIHLANVIYNLLDNAVKYTETAPDIMIRTRDAENGSLSLSIRDNGIGISSNHQAHIFQRFYRIKKGDLYTIKGFGLGLCYVKNIIELHQGQIGLSSQPGQGSEFVIGLPQH
jgi:two-component system phosphate regulon sensor histidine kinase PhoR